MNTLLDRPQREETDYEFAKRTSQEATRFADAVVLFMHDVFAFWLIAAALMTHRWWNDWVFAFISAALLLLAMRLGVKRSVGTKKDP